MSEFDVSVVIACHSERRWPSITAAIESVRAQSEPPLQLILTVDHNQSLADRLRAAFPDITVVQNTSSIRGASANRNAGAAASTSSITAFLDDDEVAEPDWLERLVQPFGDPKVVGTGGRYVANWQTKEPFWFPNEFAWVVGAHHDGMPGGTAKVRNVWAGNMAVRSSDFRAVDGFRVDFGKVGDRSQPEDTDLCIRMARAHDGHWMYVPSAVIHHEVPADRSSFRFFVSRCFSEGHGKAAMSSDLSDSEASDPTLADEGEYLRRTVPLGALAQLVSAVQSLARVFSMTCGVVAAGIGGVMAIAERRKRG